MAHLSSAPPFSPFTGADHGAHRGFVGPDAMELHRPQQLQSGTLGPCARATADAGAEGDHVLIGSGQKDRQEYGELSTVTK